METTLLAAGGIAEDPLPPIAEGDEGDDRVALRHLFQPLRVGPMEITNRLVMSCMAGGFAADGHGYPLDSMIGYYVERAKSRPGMMGIGAGAVVFPHGGDHGPEHRKMSLTLWEDGCIDPLRRFTDAIHQHDTKFGIQLWEGGLQAGGRVQLTPSGVGISAASVSDKSFTPSLKILTRDEVRRTVEEFAEGAIRCMKAGFDFVEIHAGHGYLISSFMTPHFNTREDEYGGSFENRTRFLIEILRAVKDAVGGRLAVGVKYNGSDYLPEGGWTVADAERLAPVLEAEGADYLSMTAGVMGSPRLTVPPLYEPQACFLEGGEAVKKTVSIPVSIVGRIKDPVMADALIRDGKVDLVSMGRPFIADPEIAQKAREGRIKDIRPCLADCRGCLDQQMRTIKRGETPQTSCIVNPRAGREAELVEIPGDKVGAARRILVVGAGVAGLEAARRAAFSGHQVVLCESRGQIGGQLRFAEKIPGRHEIGDIIPWYGRQLGKLGVDLRLGTEVTEQLIDEIGPDVVVVATGSLPGVAQQLTTALYGIENIEVVMGDDLLEHDHPVGDTVLVLGGEQIGLQIADYLSEAGKQVWVAEESGHFASKLAANDRWYLTSRILSKRVQRIKKLRGLDVLPGDRVILTTAEGEQELPGIDTIVIASERQPQRGLAEVAERMGIETHVIGDAADVLTEDSATIFANIAQGYDLARHL